VAIIENLILKGLYNFMVRAAQIQLISTITENHGRHV
jgi:hypothetical protein